MCDVALKHCREVTFLCFTLCCQPNGCKSHRWHNTMVTTEELRMSETYTFSVIARDKQADRWHKLGYLGNLLTIAIHYIITYRSSPMTRPCRLYMGTSSMATGARCRVMDKDGRKLDKRVRRASLYHGLSLGVYPGGGRQKDVGQADILHWQHVHPLHQTVESLCCSFSLRQSAAIKLYNNTKKKNAYP